MRITTKMLNQTLINNINTNLQKMEEYQNQISSTKLITKPSDDPIATGQLLSTKSALKAQEQYTRNMEDATGWLDTADVALAQANDVLHRARESAVAGSTGTTTIDSMVALAYVVDGLVGEMVQIANTNYGGRYIFGGGKSSVAPFSITGQEDSKITAVQFGDDNFEGSSLDETSQKLDQVYAQKIAVEAGVTIDVSSGRMTFHTNADGADEVNAVFGKLIELRTALDKGDKDAVGQLLGAFDKLLDNVLSERAVVGAKVNRMESALKRASTYELNLTKLVSKLEDADYAKDSISFNSQQIVYQASLSVGAKIIQPSLLEFLR